MLKVHGVQLSPFVRKVLLVLDYKGIDYESIPVMPGSDDPAFRAISPLGKVPALVDGDFSIPDTSIICRYIERNHPDNPVYPSDPKLEARACWLEELGDSKLIDACATLFRERFLNPNMMGTATDEAKVTDVLENQLPPLMDYLEAQLAESGPFVGDHPTIGDISILTCFIQATYGNFEIDGAKYPKLRRWYDGCMAHDAVKARMQKEQAALKAMTG
jgi:glutathione S-transferase